MLIKIRETGMKVYFYLNYSRGRLFAVAVDKIFQLREVQGLIVYASDEIAPTWIEESNFNFVPLFSPTNR